VLDPSLLHAIRSAVREELSAARSEPERRAGEPSAGDESVAETPDSVAAVESARALVEAAQQARRWTRADAASLRSAMVRMTAAERDEILSILVPAVNRDEIRPDEPGLLF
jgi:hypothetical protein